jgi:hypothetical protein
MLRFVFVKQLAGMFHNDSCCFSNKTCRSGDRAQKSWRDELQQRHLPMAAIGAKNRALAQTRQTWFGNDQAVQ